MSQGQIHDVLVVPLKKVVNERGHLLEVQRNDDCHFPGFGQVYLTATKPGVVKAWYRHHRQIDQIALAEGTLQLVLYDARDASPTCGMVQEILIDDNQPALVQIPTGIWHGFRAVGNEPALLLHLNTIPYSFEDTDEDRLPSAAPEIPFRWDA
ncbi:MAG: dTDP-4-dehydrorhamnose 3,5-epimerase family protein [Planctomycetia bacterium]|nr:dTDP-4-dehydrorhamnose 3,5-epimerase family protein [Planctomycetia bacterium]